MTTSQQYGSKAVESGSRAVDHGHGNATLYSPAKVVLPVKMSNTDPLSA